MAAKLFGTDDPIGRRIGNSVVVGVAENVKNSGLTEQSAPEMYTLRRSVPGGWDSSKFVVVLNSVMPAKAVEPWLRSQVAAIDPTVPVQMEVLDQTVNRMADRPRFETALLGFFAFSGLVLASVGLYGLMAFLTTQRAREIGIRMALGATRENLLRLISFDGLRMVIVGIALGLGAALPVARWMKALLFQVSSADPLTFLIVPGILAVVAVCAIIVPARTGMRVEPAAALRSE